MKFSPHPREQQPPQIQMQRRADETNKGLLNKKNNEINELKIALAESLKLQSHYAKLLNQYDGGQRISFDNNDEWLTRLKEIGIQKSIK